LRNFGKIIFRQYLRNAAANAYAENTNANANSANINAVNANATNANANTADAKVANVNANMLLMLLLQESSHPNICNTFGSLDC